MKRRKFITYSALFVVYGCTTLTTNSTAKSNTAKSNTAKLNNDTGDKREIAAINKPEKLRFAVSDVKGIEDLRKDYEALRVVLEQTLGVKIEFFPVEDYIAAASALQLDRVDLVFTGPSEYVVMRARTNAVPIAAIKREKYYPVIAVLAQSGIKSIKDLKGKRIAMWEIGSTSGYLGPTKLLIDAGLDPKTDVKIELIGKKGLASLKDGKVDAWAGSVRRYDKFLESENLTEKDLPILVKGVDFPADPFVVNSKLDSEFVTEMQQQLLQNRDKILEAIAPADGNKFTGAKMVEVQDADYDTIRDVYRAIGQGSFLQN
jgi:phosphonate transport system substrate-binding protein